MSDVRIKVRANRSNGELEIEGPAQAVTEWWDRLWAEVSSGFAPGAVAPSGGRRVATQPAPALDLPPDVFGEYYAEFRPDITDVDKTLVAGAFVQGNEQDKTFSTKAANQLLLDQNIKVANASANVRRLIEAKRVFVVSGGKFRVSSSGLEYLKSLKANT